MYLRSCMYSWVYMYLQQLYTYGWKRYRGEVLYFIFIRMDNGKTGCCFWYSTINTKDNSRHLFFDLYQTIYVYEYHLKVNTCTYIDDNDVYSKYLDLNKD